MAKKKAVKKQVSKKEEKERLEALWRVLVGIVSGIIFYLWLYVFYVVVVVHWIFALLVGKRHKGLADFGDYFVSNFYIFFRYMSGVTNRRPFPFGDLEKLNKFE